jgi:hypothetical protein
VRLLIIGCSTPRTPYQNAGFFEVNPAPLIRCGVNILMHFHLCSANPASPLPCSAKRGRGEASPGKSGVLGNTRVNLSSTFLWGIKPCRKVLDKLLKFNGLWTRIMHICRNTCTGAFRRGHACVLKRFSVQARVTLFRIRIT